MPARLLCIFAHPDDESFCGVGMLARYLAEGAECALVTATRGEAGKVGDPPVCSPDALGACRESEWREVVALVGIQHAYLLDYRDRELVDAPPARIREQLVAVIRRHRPHVVLTFDPNGFNVHPDHVAISRFTSDALAAAADARWFPENGPAHQTARLLWTPPVPPWEAARHPSVRSEPGVDFVVDVRAWREMKKAALRAHRTQHLSIDRYFLHQPDLETILSFEVFRQALGPRLTRTPESDVLAGIDIVD